MYSVLRSYSGKGATALFELIGQRKGEVEGVLSKVPGFVSYTAVLGDASAFTVTVCQDKAGTDESLRVAKEWIAKNAADTGVGAPQVTEGQVIIKV